MSVADSLPCKREESPSHTFLVFTLPSRTSQEFCGNTLENNPIPLLLTKSKTLTQLSWLMCSKSAELQSQPFPSPFLHQMFGVYILIPREQSAVLEFLSVQHYRVHLTTSCSAFILLQPCPSFFKFTILFPPVFVSESEKHIPVNQRAPTFLLPGSGVCSFETKA